MLSTVRFGLAEQVSVPPELQAALMSKACSYDRNFRARAGDKVRILIVSRAGSARSDASAESMKGVLAKLDDFAGLPHDETIAPFVSAEALASRCRSERIAVVYLAPGLEDDVEAIRARFSGVDVLTVGAVPAYVESGIVLGFDLVSGRSKILLNLAQAKSQHVEFPASVLALMRIVSR